MIHRGDRRRIWRVMRAVAAAVTGDFLTTELSEPLTTEAGENLLWEA